MKDGISIYIPHTAIKTVKAVASGAVCSVVGAVIGCLTGVFAALLYTIAHCFFSFLFTGSIPATQPDYFPFIIRCGGFLGMGIGFGVGVYEGWSEKKDITNQFLDRGPEPGVMD